MPVATGRCSSRNEPSRAATRAIAWPMPDEAPVTTIAGFAASLLGVTMKWVSASQFWGGAGGPTLSRTARPVKRPRTQRPPASTARASARPMQS